MDKSEMVLSGILPIDNLTETTSCIERLIETRLPFNTIVSNYGIMQSCLSKGFKVRFTCGCKSNMKFEYRKSIWNNIFAAMEIHFA